MTTLSIDGLTIGYGAHTVLQNLTLPVLTDGEIVGVLGANGAGKSTLLRTLAGLLPCRGSVHLNGVAMCDRNDHKSAGLIGYLPQTLPQQSTLIAYEAVFSACRAVRNKNSSAEAEAATESIFTRLGIRHMAMQPMNKLSGGQRQMIGLAQVLVGMPDLILLDEPTSALDLRWQMSVFDIVRGQLDAQGGVCLAALHDINLAMRHCDKLMVLGGGTLISFGTPEEAMTPKTLKDAYGVGGRIETCSQGRRYFIADTTYT